MAYIRNGYKAISMPSHHRAYEDGMVYVHILEAEKKLGRKLRESEEVHHEDEDRLNNNHENLYIFATKSDHVRYHNTGIKIMVEDYWISPSVLKEADCEICGDRFKFNPKQQTGKFCTQECYNKSEKKRKVERPSKEILLELIKSNTFVSIGKMFNVSDNAVRKWCKSYDLPYRKKDIKHL